MNDALFSQSLKLRPLTERSPDEASVTFVVQILSTPGEVSVEHPDLRRISVTERNWRSDELFQKHFSLSRCSPAFWSSCSFCPSSMNVQYSRPRPWAVQPLTPSSSVLLQASPNLASSPTERRRAPPLRRPNHQPISSRHVGLPPPSFLSKGRTRAPPPWGVGGSAELQVEVRTT